jgi:hypothetical protein
VAHAQQQAAASLSMRVKNNLSRPPLSSSAGSAEERVNELEAKLAAEARARHLVRVARSRSCSPSLSLCSLLLSMCLSVLVFASSVNYLPQSVFRPNLTPPSFQLENKVLLLIRQLEAEQEAKRELMRRLSKYASFVPLVCSPLLCSVSKYSSLLFPFGSHMLGTIGDYPSLILFFFLDGLCGRPYVSN